MLFKGARKLVLAVVAGDKVEVVGPGRVDSGSYSFGAGAANWSGWQAAMAVGVVW